MHPSTRIPAFRENKEIAKLIVIVLTSSNEPVDLNRAYKNGANSYIVKPPTPEQLTELAESFELWWLKQNTIGAS